MSTGVLFEGDEETNLVSGDKVPDEEQHAHHNVFSNRRDVRASDLEDLETLFHRGIKIDVVRANTSGDTELQVLSL